MTNGNDSTNDIFVQIPAYRDSELLATIRNLMCTAQRPERLRVAIAWQYGREEEVLEDEIRRWPNVELLKIPATQSQGCNWARSLLQQRWGGEPYTLFLDSHHRFADGWDEQVIEIYEERRHAGVAKPIVTAYLPPYRPRDDPQGRTECVFAIDVQERHQGMLFRLTGHPIHEWKSLSSPVPARFASLHFLFTRGAFNREIPFDPAIYFFADEVAIALRAYTSGYDLFHPHRILGWHLYDRSTRITHWSDHDVWQGRQQASCRRLRELYRARVPSPYGVGALRSVTDYEAFAGTPLIV